MFVRLVDELMVQVHISALNIPKLGDGVQGGGGAQEAGGGEEGAGRWPR